MSDETGVLDATGEIIQTLNPEARDEFEKMGLGTIGDAGREPIRGIDPVRGRERVPRRAIEAPGVLNEAYDYDKPSSFTRGLRVELPGATMLYLSGTASVDEKGDSIHLGNFEAQCLRTFRNLTELLVAEGASWHDIIRTTCYLRDIDRDYDRFNQMRTMFMNSIGLDPLPASTGIEAHLCRPDLLIEIEAIAVVPQK